MREINLIILHCSANSNPRETIADIRKFHTAPPPLGRGWKDVGYHYVIDHYGLIQPGRDISQEGSHCHGHNADSIGICLSGLSLTDFTENQFISLRTVLSDLHPGFPQASIHPHHEFNDGKLCPVYDVAPFQSYYAAL